MKYKLYMIDKKTKKQLPGYKEFSFSHPCRSYIIKLARKYKEITFTLRAEDIKMPLQNTS